MNSGSYFNLNLEASKVVEGVAVFDYVDLPDFGVEHDIMRYPIRLTITPDDVSFIVHFYDAEDNPHHVEEVILVLPCRTNNTEKLSSIIKQIYNSPFPYSGYLQKLMQRRYGKKQKDDDARYNSLNDSQINYDSYSSLPIWGLLDNYAGSGHYLLHAENEERITKFLRKLLLDFMFDLIHSDVFGCSKYYSQMKEGLMEDFFFSAIVKKSEYYYYRRLLRTRFSSFKGDYQTISEVIGKWKAEAQLNGKIKKNDVFIKKCINTIIKDSEKKSNQSICNKTIQLLNKRNRFVEERNAIKADIHKYELTDSTLLTIKNLYADKLDQAEEKWIDAIMSPMADKHFLFPKKWYEKRKKQEEPKYNEFGISDSWFASPEKEMQRIAFPLNNEQDSSKENVLYLNSFELAELVGTDNNDSVVSRNTIISKWFYRRFDFRDAFRIHFFRGWNGALVASLLLFSIAPFLPIICNELPSLWEYPSYLACFLLIMSMGCLVIGVRTLFNIQFCRKKTNKTTNNNKLDGLLVLNRRKREGCRALRLTLFFLFFAAFFSFSESETILCAVGKIVLMILITVALIEKPRQHVRIPNIHLFLPRLAASITAAWMMLVIGNEIIKEHISIPLCIIVSFIVFSFVLYENNKTIPNVSTNKTIWRSLELMVISYFFSLVIGVFALDILGASLLLNAEKTGLLYHSWPFVPGNKNFTLIIFPKYLVQFSFLAMFIGVFIQMIFEEKNIAEL